MSIDSGIQKLLESGLLGVLLVISLVTIWFLYGELKSERNARIEDLKQSQELDRDIVKEVKSTMQAIYDLLIKKNA